MTSKAFQKSTEEKKKSTHPKKIIIVLLEQMGFECVSHPSSHFKKIFVRDNLVVHIEEKELAVKKETP